MPQYPSRSGSGASGIYGANQLTELALGKNLPLPAPTVAAPTSVSATQNRNDIEVSFTPSSSINSLGTQALPNPNPTTSDFFGQIMASFENWLVVGAPEADITNSNTGSVYVYYVSDGVSKLVQRIDGTIIGGKFGSSVDIYNDLLVIGAPGTSSAPIIRGAVYVYQLAETGGAPWRLLSTLTNNNWTLFGTSVSTDGLIVAVGSRGTNTSQGNWGDGAIWMYKRSNTESSTWDLVYGLPGGGDVANGQEGTSVGWAVNVRNGHLIYTRNAGSAYLGQVQWFDVFDGWGGPRAQRLRPVTMQEFGNTGLPYINALTRFEDLVAFGCAGSTTTNCVAVFKISPLDLGTSVVFDGTNVTTTSSPGFQLIQKFLSPINNINFGCSVALNKNELAIGAELADVGGTDTGSVYYYTRMQGSIPQTQYSLLYTLQASSVQANGRFGASLAFNENGKPNNHLWIGEPRRTVNSSSNAGSVWAINPQIQYHVSSVPGNISGTGRSSPIKLPLSSFTTGQPYNFVAAAWRAESGAGAVSSPSASVTPEIRGSAEFNVPGTYTWICPAGVTTVAAVAVGGGGGGGYNTPGKGGGALAYRNGISVTPGQSYTIVVGVGGSTTGTGSTSVAGGNSTAFGMVAGAGTGTAGNFQGGVPSGTYTGGGNGGNAAIFVNQFDYIDGDGNPQTFPAQWVRSLGAGGAGGYSGNGGNGGGVSGDGNFNIRTNGAGGGGAGGSGGDYFSVTNANGVGGGGVGLFGQGANGVGDGKGGSGGEDWNQTLFPFVAGSTSGTTGRYGGGAGGVGFNKGGPGAHGGVRIIWGTVLGTTRAFPSTGAGNI